jgi:hypothetical protein
VEGAEALASEFRTLILRALALTKVDPQETESDAAPFDQGFALGPIDPLDAVRRAARKRATLKDEREAIVHTLASVSRPSRLCAQGRRRPGGGKD